MNGTRLILPLLIISGLLFIPEFFSTIKGQLVLSDIETSVLQYKIGNSPVKVTNSIRVDGRNIISATISISSGYARGSDMLSYKGTRFSASWNEANGELTLSGLGAANNYREALRNIFFETTSNPGNRVISFTISSWFTKSNTVSRTVNVESPNTAPVLGNVSADPAVYCVNDESILIVESITVNDKDSEILTSALIEISLGYSVNEDMLLFTNMNGITGSWNSTNGQLTLTGNASVANYQEALRSVRFQNKNPENPHAGFHEITFRISDGIAWSNKISRSVTHPVPTAAISGDFSICIGELASLPVTFTGTGPWNFSYRLNSGQQVTLHSITSNPYSLPVGDPGSYTLVSVNDKFCPGKTSGSAMVSLKPEPEVKITGLNAVYSKESTEMIPLTAEPSGGVFSGPGVIPLGQDWVFLPSLPAPGIIHIVYKYRPDELSCYGYDTAEVRIVEKTAAIETEGNRTKFCINDKPFGVTGINLLNNSFGTFSITGGKGLVDHGNNTATVYPDSVSINVYVISYTPPDGFTTTMEIEFGNPLKADFTWDKECFEPGSPISFINTSTSPFGFLTGKSYSWKINTGSDSVQLTTEDISYAFTEAGNYTVELKVTNSNGCVNQTSKVYSLRPVYALADLNYTDNFETLREWDSGHDPSWATNSWVLGKPEMLANGFSSPHSGETCWFTNIEVNPAPREYSWITSPCFDFRGTEKPTLVANIRRSFTDTRDGANISYTIDNGLHWNLVGNLNDGINWFNSYFGNPGAQSQGWTSIIDNEWVESRHILDFLKGEKNVQFRVNFITSGGAIGNKGIAVDDIKIVGRNRTILVEHFTNISALANNADNMLNEVAQNAGSGLIDLHYHISDPDDPFYLFNPVPSDTRQFYYGISGAPYSIINGGTHQNQHFDYVHTVITQSQVGIESLYESDFDLKVTSMHYDDRLYAEIVVTALQDVPLIELSVRTVVFEPMIIDSNITDGRSTFRNVVRSMIPDAAGKSIYSSWVKGQTYRIVEEWEIGDVFYKQGLRLAAFLQNEMSREIHQAALDQTGLINAVDGTAGPQSSVFLYPVPAYDWLFIDIADDRNVSVIEILNTSGTVLHSETVTGDKTISVKDFPAGLYLLKSTSRGRTEIHKFIVTH